MHAHNEMKGMSTLVIGRKELFSFADRYSSRRLSDYSSLADGEVLCCLFNLVFPGLRIRPAPAQTHSSTQRAHANWEQLFRRFARLHIPLSFLDPAALRSGSVECGFSTLVLFYFFHHLSKQPDFSAEFALDVAEEVTTYLQSTDCIATLLLGGALQWAAVPEPLAETLRVHPAFHTTAEAEMAQEEEAARTYRSMFARRRTGSANSVHKLPATRRAHSCTTEKQSGIGGPSSTRLAYTSSPSAASSSTPGLKVTADSPPPRPPLRNSSAQSTRSSTSRLSSSNDVDSSVDFCGLQRQCSSERRTRSAEACDVSQPRAQSQRSSSWRSASSSRSSGNSHSSTMTALSCQSSGTADTAVVKPSRVPYRSASSVSAATGSQGSAVPSSRARDVALEAALQSKEAECESLQMQVAQLLTLLANTRAADTASAATNGGSHVRSPSPRAAAAEQRGDIADDASTARLQLHYADRIEELETQLRAYREASDKRQALSSPSPAPAAPAPPPPSGATMDKAALEAEIAALTANIVDDETGTTVVDVHEKANLLHCLMLEHLQEAPRNRKQMQQWLWSIVAAHHTMEGRLMAAVDLLRLWSSTLPAADVGATAVANSSAANREASSVAQRSQSTVAAPFSAASPGRNFDRADSKGADHEEMTALRSAHYAELEALHAREHQLAAALQAAQTNNAATVQRAVRRERLWKSLCASVYAAEQASYAITECRTAEEVEERLRQREEHYGVVESLTQQLVEDGEQEGETCTQHHKIEATSGSPAPCRSLQTLVAQLQEERAELLRDVTRLHYALASLEEERGSTVHADVVKVPKALPSMSTYASTAAAPLFSDDLHRKSAAVAAGGAAGTSTARYEGNPSTGTYSPGPTSTPRGLTSLLQLREGEELPA
ncbi:conserved hypothetical protein [Leishmania mexicana MHOM/GT/2001/U1103]|uniref:Uncharacterized protein n=1 Tax=Leishmania mexicana (strain MHOM/GT/2001/U1103) TaxID=929439 RepID=E9AJP6_LEIMU|nr:conserved hypothetical protein [Leishmania mexicana MHOM/GT/2001/U1103]CBZ23145.1 conserved hypothetical protein [Leishmania mexicana MHOM/GT/2001/U1103]